MFRISTNLVEPGNILGRPVIDGQGYMLLGKGVELTSQYIDKLKRMGIGAVYIDSGEMNEIVSYENVVSDETYQQVIRNTKEMVNMLASPRENLDLNSAKKSVETLVDEIIRNRGTLLDVSALHDFDEYTFTHSVSVCVTSTIIGLDCGLSRQELYVLGMGALLHDIGKIKVPQQILNKPGKLTTEEFAIMRQHAQYGFDILRKNASLLSAHVAFQHQEKFDGTGYPRGMKGQDIHLFGRIAAVADVYDALTSKRPYRDPMPNNKAYEYIWSQSRTHFDPDVVKHFCGTVAIYPNGSVVKLSNGEKALVVKQNSGWALRPVVFLMENNKITKQINLMDDEHSDLVIIE